MTGLRDGGAVAVLLRNDVVLLECMLAAATVGAYYLPINWHSTAEELRFILDDVEPSHLVIHADLYRRIRHAIPGRMNVLVVPTPAELCAAYGIGAVDAVPPDGVTSWDDWITQWSPWTDSPGTLRGTMIYTSGTTGRPKAIRRDPIPPQEREAYAKLRAEWFGFRPGLRTAIIGPMYHSVQLTYAHAALQSGGTVLLEPRFDAEALLDLISDHKLTHLHLVPTMMHRLVSLPRAVRDRFDPSSLEFVIHGAAPCPHDVKRSLIDWWGPIVHEYYGTSESGMVSRSSSEEWLARPGTVGRPWPGRIVRIDDDAGAPVPPNTEGLVYMSLGQVPNFTYHNAETRRSEIERDGLVTTGDIGYLDEDGYLFLCDRRQDVVIAGGVKIWPAEVEGVLMGHPAVADCAVFAIPDGDLGQVPAAAVQLVPEKAASPEELRDYLRERIARFKVPRLITVLNQLPRDDSGKIFRRLLREPYWRRAESP